jgi:hypothetical protein
LPNTTKKPPIASSPQAGLIVRNAKGQFIQQPSKEVRGSNAHRPSLYTDVLQQKTDAWLNNHLKNKQVAWLEELCLELDIDEATMWRWHTEVNDDGTPLKPKFCKTIDKALAWQKMILKNNGIIGKFNPRMSMFLLSANHDTVEKREVKADHTTGGKPMDLAHAPRAINPEEFNDFVAQRLKQNYTKPNR